VDALFLSANTVSPHQDHIRENMNGGDAADLVKQALARRLTD
jgi:hypothetical protein